MEKDQCGSRFGERFTHSFKDFYQQEYEKAIATGNDCLSISAKDFLSTAKNLKENTRIIGPSREGGT